MTTHLIRVHQSHASQPYVRDMVISYQDKQPMTLHMGAQLEFSSGRVAHPAQIVLE
uniref:Uncharacterized protein n=1 Tax=Octopus bimaculoides TaxID=37653 RepID=A0A0L8GW01_OCTBM